MNNITEKDKEYVLSIEQEVNSCIKNPSHKLYTEADLKKAILWAHDKSTEGIYLSRLPINEFIQSLNQPKLPTTFKCDINVNCDGNDGNGCFMDSCGHNCGCVTVKTLINSEGRVEWVGTYKF